MSLRLTKPGLPAADLWGMVHPRTGEPIVPIGYRRDGRPLWPVMGGSGEDDPNDPKYTGDNDEDSDDDEDDEDEDDESKKGKKSSKGKHSKDDDEDDEDKDEDDDKPRYTQAEYDRIKNRMRASDRKNSELESRLRALEDKDKKPDEVTARDLADSKAKTDRLLDEVRTLRLNNAFLMANTVEWVDAEDALIMADKLGLLDDVVDDDGTVDRKALRAALRDLAKRKPHLVKKAAGGRKSDKDDDEGGDDDQGSTSRTAPSLNGKRKGRKPETDRAALAKRFPALNRVT